MLYLKTHKQTKKAAHVKNNTPVVQQTKGAGSTSACQIENTNFQWGL